MITIPSGARVLLATRPVDFRKGARGALPAHLPRIERTLAPEDTACPCCRSAMVVIGHDSAERLDVIPAQFRVLVTGRRSWRADAAPGLSCRPRPRPG